MIRRLPLASSLEADPAVAVGVGDGQRLEAHLQADHLDQAAAEHVRGVATGAAVLGHGHAGAAVAIGDVMTGGAGVDVAAVHHLGDAVGQQDAVDLAGIAVDAVALAEIALRQAFSPHVAEPGVHLLEVHRAARLPRVGGVDDADARVLEGQAAQVARRVDGIVEGIAGSLAELGAYAQDVSQRHGGRHTEDKA